MKPYLARPMTILESQSIAQMMCDVTEQHLLPYVIDWIQTKDFKYKLGFVSGMKKSTYCEYKTGNIFKIVYGSEMIKHKHDDFGDASNWLSSKEIFRHQYYGGRISFVNLLAHTCLHEFSHFVQFVMDLTANGERRKFKAHGPEFYKILSKLHLNPLAITVRDELGHRLSRNNLPLRFGCGIEEVPPEHLEFIGGLITGSPIEFNYKGKVIAGAIESINDKDGIEQTLMVSTNKMPLTISLRDVIIPETALPETA